MNCSLSLYFISEFTAPLAEQRQIYKNMIEERRPDSVRTVGTCSQVVYMSTPFSDELNFMKRDAHLSHYNIPNGGNLGRSTIEMIDLLLSELKFENRWKKATMKRRRWTKLT